MFLFMCSVLSVILVTRIEAARILAVFPFPSISHQVVFRPISQELARKGHEVVVITADPAFPKGQSIANLTEIDVHDLSYGIWVDGFLKGSEHTDAYSDVDLIFTLQLKVFEKQIQSDEIQNIIKNKRKYFDLLLVEEFVRPALIFSHLLKIPTVSINSFGYVINDVNAVGAQEHFVLYPSLTRTKLRNLNLWDKIKGLYSEYSFKTLHSSLITAENQMLKRNFGNVPTINELKKNIDLLLLNQYSFWDFNRPVPPNVINIGGIHQIPKKKLPEDLNMFLNQSTNGVIYLSFGTNTLPSQLPVEIRQIMMKVFSELPYKILWKWDKGELPGKPDNVRIQKWFPQSDLLNHKNVKLFITHGGLQSTNEAIGAEVPVLGIPLFADQWYNVDMFEHLKIGKRLDMELMSEENFRNAILGIINDKSYNQNIKKLNSIAKDEPMTPLDRAIWWIEHILRHCGGKHLRSAAANIPWWEYHELPLVSLLLGAAALLIVLTMLALRLIHSAIVRYGSSKVKKS